MTMEEELIFLEQEIHRIETPIKAVIDELQDNKGIKPEWEYLQERRKRSAMELRRDFLNLQEDINFIINRCGINIEVRE